MSIEQLQNSLVEDFSLLLDSREDFVEHIMGLGNELDPYPDRFRDANHLVSGCMSQVWLRAFLKEDRVMYQADSDSHFTKGMVCMLVLIFSGHSPEEILGAEVFFPKKINMSTYVGSQRNMGFEAMTKRMRFDALCLRSSRLSQA